MIRKVSGTILTRFLTLLGAFLIVVLNTNALGKEGQGTIALISFSIMCILALSNYVGGGAVVYLTPRLGIKKLVVPAYLWTLFVCLCVFGGLQLINFESNYIMEISILAFLHGLFTFHMQILVGKEKIREFNFLQILQVFSLLIFLFVMYKIQHQTHVEAFVLSLLASFILVWLISLIMVIRYFEKPEISSLKSSFKAIFSYSKYAQTANVLQIFNYRLNFILLEKLLLAPRGIIGIYSVGMYMSEAVWNVSKSLSTVQYSRISNVDNEKYNKRLTSTFFKVSILVTIFILTVILLLPESFYTFIFGDTFIGIKEVMYFIAPGILCNSGSVILSHHFSGIGKYRFNTIASAIGLFGTIVAGLLLIGSFELKGASITFSIAMILQFIYLVFVYLKETQTGLKSLWMTKTELKALIKRLLNKNH